MDVALENQQLYVLAILVHAGKIAELFTFIEYLPFPFSIVIMPLKFPEMAGEDVRGAVVNTTSFSGPMQGAGDRSILSSCLF